MPDELDWRPRATREILVSRAKLLRQIRDFMDARGILEVETPILDRAANSDPNIQSLSTTVGGGSAIPLRRYLHTSPEFPMKRLLADGAGPIYQIVRVFRDDAVGRFHQPEFSMLEWYRLGMDHHGLMTEVESLLQTLGLPAVRRRTYLEAFMEHCGLDPHQAGIDELQDCARGLGLASMEGSRPILLDFLFSHGVAPQLGDTPVYIYDYPVCQSALARIRDGRPALAERFELFINCIEIANGYNELKDYNEQEYRFLQDNERRCERKLEPMPLDQKLLAALRSGLPDCAGVAVGLDRLLMVLCGAKRIEEVLAFPHS